MNLWIVFIIFALLAAGDKIITVVNLHQVNKNFEVNQTFEAEKNPLARYFFDKFGLIGGTLIYYPFSILTMFISYWILKSIFNDQIALYLVMMAYGLVLMNNTFFLLKYSKVFG